MWPEASATAVRELRDRITHRPSRSIATVQPGLALSDTDTRGAQPPQSGASPQRYTNSSWFDPQNKAPSVEPNPTTSSTGLPADQMKSHGVQPAGAALNVSNDSLGQPASAHQYGPSLDDVSGLTYPASNTPVFNFSNSEWSDFVQANETLDSDATLPQVDGLDPYVGFDIPFWLGQDQYWDMLHDRN